MPVGRIATLGLPRNQDLLVTGGRDGPQIRRFQDMARGEHQLGGYNILPQRPDMAPGCHRSTDADRSRVSDLGRQFFLLLQRFDILDRDDRVRPIRQGVARIHVFRLRSNTERHRFGGQGAIGRNGPDSKAVHGRGMIMRRGDPGPDRFGCDASQCIFIERDGFGTQDAPETCFLEGLLQPGLGIGEGDVVEVDGHQEPPPRPSPMKGEGDLNFV